MASFISIKDAAIRAGVSSATIVRWAEKGHFQFERSPHKGVRLIDHGSFERFLRDHQRGHA